MDDFNKINDKIITISKDIGKLESHCLSLENRINGLERDIKEELKRIESNQKELSENLKTSNVNINAKLDEILHKKSEVKGGWKVLSFIGGLLLVLSSFIAWSVDILKG